MNIKKIILSSVFLCCVTSLSFAAGFSVKLNNNSKEDYVINMEPSFPCIKKVGGDAQVGYNRITPKNSKSITYDYATCRNAIHLYLSLGDNLVAKIECFQNKKTCKAWYTKTENPSYILKEDDLSSEKDLRFIVDKSGIPSRA